MTYRIGIDLGGTKVESIVLAPDGQEVLRRRIPTPRNSGQSPETRYTEILNAVCALVQDSVTAIEERAQHGPDQTGLTGGKYTLGVGIPGILDRTTGLVINANTTCLIGHPLQLDLEQRLQHAVAIENDANCFTAAECTNGAARGHEFVFGIIMGTGCGGGLFNNGRVRTGLHGIAGEWGHFSIDPNGRECWCGNRGCIETLISGSGVEAGHKTKFGNALPMREIVAGFRAGQSDCTTTIKIFFEDFGRALGGLISVLDPDLVVLGGGLSNIEELYTQGIPQIQKFAFHRNVKTPVVKNELGDSAGVFGAAWIGI